MTAGERFVYALVILVVGVLVAYNLAALIAVSSVDWVPVANDLRSTLALLTLITGGIYMFVRDQTRDIREWSAARWVWIAGTVSYFFARSLDLPAASALTLTPAAAALGFWLMIRYSTITRLWGELAVKVVTGWLVCAGFILMVDTSGWLALPGYVAAGFVLMAYVIVAAHIHKALINPNGAQTLAAYWHAAAVILWLVSGIVGAALTIPDVARFVLDSAIVIMPVAIGELAVIALGLGVINQIVADLRGENRRVTGLLPYWCLLGGWLVAALFELGYALVLLYDPVLSPAALQDFRAFALTIALIGAIIFALGIYARRIRLDES